VDSADLRREPQRYTAVTEERCAAAVNLLAMSAADVAGVLTCQPPRGSDGEPRRDDDDLQDAPRDLDGDLDVRDLANVERDGEERTKSSTGRDDSEGEDTV